MGKIILMVLLVFGNAVTGWGGTFKVNGNGTVTDLATGLTWQRQDDNVTRANNGPAVAYCQELDLAGDGWRLPSIKELQSIVDYRVFLPSIDTDTFPGTKSLSYWSATAYVGDSGSAWSVYFDGGAVLKGVKSGNGYVRCVR